MERVKLVMSTCETQVQNRQMVGKTELQVEMKEFCILLTRSLILEPNVHRCGIYALCLSRGNLSQTR